MASASRPVSVLSGRVSTDGVGAQSPTGEGREGAVSGGRRGEGMVLWVGICFFRPRVPVFVFGGRVGRCWPVERGVRRAGGSGSRHFGGIYTYGDGPSLERDVDRRVRFGQKGTARGFSRDGGAGAGGPGGGEGGWDWCSIAGGVVSGRAVCAS